jgi:metal-responsive CopG/Arc/MetJ family transcriptional regulator
MVLISLRVPRVLLEQVDALAADAGVDRSTVIRRMAADGVRRARAAARYTARYTARLAGEPPPPGAGS